MRGVLITYKKCIKYAHPLLWIVPLCFIAPSLIATFATVQFICLLLLILLAIVAPINKHSWVGLLVTFAAIMTPSPIFNAVFGMNGNIFYILAVILIGALVFSRIKKNTSVIVIVFSVFIIFCQLCATLFWGEAKLMILPLYFLSALLLVSTMQPIEINKFLTYSSNSLMFLVIGGLIGFFYTLVLHGEPLLFITNEDTRQNGLYLTTFSNWYVRGVIRPAGIYDEPGALSLIVCLVAAIRHSMGRSKKTTWVLLVLGSLTLSMAHVIYMFLHLMEELKQVGVKLNYKRGVVLLLIALLILATPLGDVLNEFLFGRFAIVDGAMQGDNRSALLFNSINYLNWTVFFFGLDASCIVNVTECFAQGYNQFGDNPLGPLVLGGIFQFSPFYIVVITLLFMAIKRRSAIIFAVMLLLLQRNEVMSFGYAMLVMVFLVVTLKSEMIKKWSDSMLCEKITNKNVLGV